MHGLRKCMGWAFGISSILCILGEYSVVMATIQMLRRHPYTSWNFRTWSIVLLWSAIIPVTAIIFGIAWWTIWKGKRSARCWGIAASLIFVMISLYVFFIISKWVLCAPGVELAIGIVGLLAFSRRYETKAKRAGSANSDKGLSGSSARSQPYDGCEEENG